jgi:hypothetical protein
VVYLIYAHFRQDIYRRPFRRSVHENPGEAEFVLEPVLNLRQGADWSLAAKTGEGQEGKSGLDMTQTLIVAGQPGEGPYPLPSGRARV